MEHLSASLLWFTHFTMVDTVFSSFVEFSLMDEALSVIMELCSFAILVVFCMFLRISPMEFLMDSIIEDEDPMASIVAPLWIDQGPGFTEVVDVVSSF